MSKETKAVIISNGETDAFELITSKGITKEAFEESRFEKSTTTSAYGPEVFGNTIQNKTIKIGDQDVYSIGFEDGSIYVVGKGFLPAKHKTYVAKTVKALTPKA